MRTSDPRLSLFFLQAKDVLPAFPSVPDILQESELIHSSQSELWFPNFLLRGVASALSLTFTCLQSDPSATVKVRSRTGVVLKSEFIAGEVYAGLVLTSETVKMETVLVSAAVKMSDWDRVV